MSGGSLDYVYGRVGSAAEEVMRRANTPLQRAFATHLQLVAEALHDLEWVYSSDYGPGDEVKAIRACLSPDAELAEAHRRVLEAIAEFQAIKGATK